MRLVLQFVLITPPIPTEHSVMQIRMFAHQNPQHPQHVTVWPVNAMEIKFIRIELPVFTISCTQSLALLGGCASLRPLCYRPLVVPLIVLCCILLL